MSDVELIEKLRDRTKGWSLNDDKAWIKVKLGEVRAVLDVIDRKAIPSKANTETTK